MMNVYDFDGTIYSGDSTLDFWLFCLKRKPSIFICFPRQLVGAIKYKLGIIDKTHFKEEFFSFLNKLNDTHEFVKLFWNINEKKILNWYKNNQRADDVIISASPSFLLKEICNRLEIKILIASRVNYKTGKFIGLNCYGDEKVRRFIECFPDENIDEFYTDSRADKPLAVLARKAYLIKNGEKTIWNF